MTADASSVDACSKDTDMDHRPSVHAYTPRSPAGPLGTSMPTRLESHLSIISSPRSAFSMTSSRLRASPSGSTGQPPLNVHSIFPYSGCVILTPAEDQFSRYPKANQTMQRDYDHRLLGQQSPMFTDLVQSVVEPDASSTRTGSKRGIS